MTSKSKIQPVTALSVTEAELIAACSCAQDLMFEKCVIESIGLQVKVPMELEVDNRGTVDLINNWSVGGNTRHIDCRLNFMRELKEEGILKVMWMPGKENSADLFTKNLMGPEFEKHSSDYVSDRILKGENVGVMISNSKSATKNEVRDERASNISNEKLRANNHENIPKHEGDAHGAL